MNAWSLLAGPDPRAGAEPFGDHRRRLGPLPAGRPELIQTLERSQLLGRGGGGFPVGTKWRAVAGRSSGSAVVLVNGAEGEPLSRKDQALMVSRPHLVLDGAFLAADTVGADRVVLYVSERFRAALASLERAIRERPAVETRRVDLCAAPARYVAGEESAAVNFVNSGAAMPTTIPPRPYERGVDGRPTLVQNVESLAHAALIARWGDEWFRSQGRNGAAGSLLLTVGGAVPAPAVYEVPAGSTVGEALSQAGGPAVRPRAVLLGGYFGTWLDTSEAWHLPLEPAALAGWGSSLGCGVLWVLSSTASPLEVTAGMMRYLAAESSAQCGPCFFGLRSLADACARVASGRGEPGDVARLQRWNAQVMGRGACRHPDGAVRFLRSALRVFASEFGMPSRTASFPAAWTTAPGEALVRS